MSTETNIATGLSRIGLYLRSAAWDRAGANRLTPTQAQMLAHLSARGPCRLGNLAAEAGVTQPTASDAAAALIRKELIDKRPDPADGRASLLHLTADGRQVVRETAVWPDALLGAFDAIGTEDRAGFLRSLMAMIGALQESGEIPAQRICATCIHFRPNAYPGNDRRHHCAFVDAAFGDAALRLDCADHKSAGELVPA